MSPKIQSSGVTLTVANFRTALREKLLSIVRSVPTQVTDTAGSGALVELRKGHSCTLLLDPGVEDLNLEELVTTIRIRYPKLSVVVLERNDGSGHLPCEFGGSPLRATVTPNSPIARAAAASHWSVLRALGPDRVNLRSRGERRANPNENPVCPWPEGRD